MNNKNKSNALASTSVASSSSASSRCNSPSPPCSQDTYYTKRRDTLQNGSQFLIGIYNNPNENLQGQCTQGAFANNAQNNYLASVCNDKTTEGEGIAVLDPNILQNACSDAQTYSVPHTSKIPPFALNYTYYWYLPGACIPMIPNLGPYDLARCCSLGIDCSNSPYCCPPGICKDSKKCADLMPDFCKVHGLDFEQCDNYINTSSNQDGVSNTVQTFVNYQLTNNNQTLQNQPRIKDIVKMCSASPPGTCDNIMKNQCQIYSREEIEADPNLATLCGCFMRDSNYKEYQNLISSNGKLQTQCDPACMNAYAIQPAGMNSDGSMGCKFAPCNSPVCIIDFRNKNVQKAWANNIDLSQNCVAVGTSPSKCFIGMSKDEAELYLTKDITISQKCDKSFLWDTSLANPILVPIDTSDPVGSIARHYGINIPPRPSKYRIVIIIGIILGGIILIAILYFVFRK